MSLSDPMPAAWLAHAFTLSERNLPACNVLDRTEELPRCRVRPMADRLLEELMRNGRVDVRTETMVFTVRAKANKVHGVLFAIYQGKDQREPYQALSRETIEDWFSRLRPVLRVVRGRP